MREVSLRSVVRLHSAVRAELEERVIEFWRGKLEIKNDLPYRRQFDIITSFHVFEHLSDPIHHLRKLKASLTDNGWIVIEIANADDALLTIR